MPVFFTFDVSDPGPCPDPSAGTTSHVTLTWEVVGAESVDIAAGNIGAPVVTGLPPASSIKLPRPCPGPTTYYVIAENPDGRTVEDASR